MQTILVTGGTGFVGSHTCFTLLKNNYKVVVIDSLVNSSSISLNRVVDLLKIEIPRIEENLKFVYGDLRNLDFCNLSWSFSLLLLIESKAFDTFA